MITVCLDTSVIIEFARTQQGILFDLFVKQSEGEHITLITSSLVVFEFWSGRSMNNPEVEHIATELFQKFTVFQPDDAIARQAGELSRNSSIPGFDSIIATTSLKHANYLATLNTKHFSKVPGLKLWGE